MGRVNVIKFINVTDKHGNKNSSNKEQLGNAAVKSIHMNDNINFRKQRLTEIHIEVIERYLRQSDMTNTDKAAVIEEIINLIRKMLP